MTTRNTDSNKGTRFPRPETRIATTARDLPEAPGRETLDELLTKHGIREWEALLVGDGSGSGWDGPCGWASVLIERGSPVRRVWYGSMNRGTISIAELMAYLQPLTWMEGRKDLRKPYRVHIITDSEYCRDMGRRRNRGGVKNAGFWSAFDVFQRRGLILFWHWARRDTNDLNRYVDALSKLARQTTKSHNLREGLKAQGFSVLQCNPTTEP